MEEANIFRSEIYMDRCEVYSCDYCETGVQKIVQCDCEGEFQRLRSWIQVCRWWEGGRMSERMKRERETDVRVIISAV